jgi:hypothetical protein
MILSRCTSWHNPFINALLTITWPHRDGSFAGLASPAPITRIGHQVILNRSMVSTERLAGIAAANVACQYEERSGLKFVSFADEPNKTLPPTGAAIPVSESSMVAEAAPAAEL